MTSSPHSVASGNHLSTCQYIKREVQKIINVEFGGDPSFIQECLGSDLISFIGSEVEIGWIARTEAEE